MLCYPEKQQTSNIVVSLFIVCVKEWNTILIFTMLVIALALWQFAIVHRYTSSSETIN
jgi:hypothetical protein